MVKNPSPFRRALALYPTLQLDGAWSADFAQGENDPVSLLFKRSFSVDLKSRSLWASEFSLSNDLLEGKWIKQLVAESCDERAIKGFMKKRLLDALDDVIASWGAAGFCLSEDGDVLSQWRGYANDGAGVAIGFERLYIENLAKTGFIKGSAPFELKRVEYNADKQKSAIENNLTRIFDLLQETPEAVVRSIVPTNTRSKLRLELTLLWIASYTLKNPAFREELEWRLITQFPTGASPEALDTALAAVNAWKFETMEFRALRDRIVPFADIKLEAVEARAITEVILGPKNITPLRIVEAALSRYGWGRSIRVKKSAASYR